MSSIFTHSTPGLVLIYSISLIVQLVRIVSKLLEHSTKQGSLQKSEGTLVLPLQHQQSMRMAAYIRMDGNGEAKLFVLAVKIVKVIPP